MKNELEQITRFIREMREDAASWRDPRDFWLDDYEGYVRGKFGQTLSILSVQALITVLNKAMGWYRRLLGDDELGMIKIKSTILSFLGDRKGKEVTETLIEMLKQNEPELRQGTIWALGKIKEAEVINAIIDRLLNDESEHVRLAAANNLKYKKDKRVTQAFVDALEKDEDGSVRVAAIWGLQERKGEEVVQCLKNALENDGSERVRNEAAEALQLCFRSRES